MNRICSSKLNWLLGGGVGLGVILKPIEPERKSFSNAATRAFIDSFSSARRFDRFSRCRIYSVAFDNTVAFVTLANFYRKSRRVTDLIQLVRGNEPLEIFNLRTPITSSRALRHDA